MAQSHNSNTVLQVPDDLGEIEMADSSKDAAGDTNDESMDQNSDEVGWDACWPQQQLSLMLTLLLQTVYSSCVMQLYTWSLTMQSVLVIAEGSCNLFW